jgi:GMP synthase (glutamine-hydrolysing)
MKNDILIIDFGSQVTQLIARRVREAGVYCEIIPYHAAMDFMAGVQGGTLPSPKAIVLSGGPASVSGADAPSLPEGFWQWQLPMLGICYGQQLMAASLGGRVEPAQASGEGGREYGRATVQVVADSPLLGDLWQPGQEYPVWMSHGDKVTALPPAFALIASSQSAPVAIMADEAAKRYGVQFHPEVVHTPDGTKLLHNFLFRIAGCQPDWQMASYREQAVATLRQQIGTERVICAISGGVDSAVTAALLHQAVGDQLSCFFIDNGLLRHNETADVMRLLITDAKLPVEMIDASALFLGRLAGVEDPEQKRKIIGASFIEVFEQACLRFGPAGSIKFLAQGTLYPDVIESVSASGGPSVTIKSHHNVGGLPEHLRFELVEPLRLLFKDEVRLLGRELGLPPALLGRHPFPGPGLAIRIPGAITPDKLALLRAVDHVYITALREAGYYDQIWQAFAVLLPVKTVGVMGDGRTYDYACALRAVTSTDGMTADVFPFPPEFLIELATKIINNVPGVNRVTYDITSKPPGTIEWE